MIKNKIYARINQKIWIKKNWTKIKTEFTSSVLSLSVILIPPFHGKYIFVDAAEIRNKNSESM